MMKFNKINFGLLMLLFLCRFENILGVSDKNIEEGLNEKYKIVDLKGNILKNEKGEDFSFIVTCEYNGYYYKWFEGIESVIDDIKKEENLGNQWNMKKKLGDKSGVSSDGDIVKTKDGKVLVVKDSEKENKVYLVLGIYDKDSKTANIFLDKNCNLQTFGPYYIIEENNTASVEISTSPDCGGVEIKEGGARKFQIVCCKLEDKKPGVILKELVDSPKKFIEQADNFDKNSCCCDRLCNWCKDLCP